MNLFGKIIDLKIIGFVIFVILVVAILLILAMPDKILKGADYTEYVRDGSVLFLNTTKDSKYVGSENCRKCHEDIYDAYMKSPKGRSMSILDTTNIIEEFPQKEVIYDTVNNFYYEMVRKDDRFYQREYRLDSSGNLIHERWMEARYVMGSGSNLRMYLNDENGMFYELPLTWYVHKKRWDLSLGYREFKNVRFYRVISAMCFSCHNGYMEMIPGANDRYKQPYPIGIGCESCHGPGDLHSRQCEGEDIDLPEPGALTIVNPPKLSPQRRNDVCFQCHLEGKTWVAAENKSWFDFRPGMLLENNRSVYSSAEKKKEGFIVANSGYRLSLSRCSQNSHGNMTCDICHDSHRMLQTSKKEYNRQNCQKCHRQESFPKKSARLKASRSDCIVCHMNRTGKTNTLHGVENHDHWIRINADYDLIDWSSFRKTADKRPLIKLVPDVDRLDNAQTLRKGMAYAELYWADHDTRREYLDSAFTYISEGLKDNSNEGIGYYYLGRVVFEFGRYTDAIKYLNKNIEINPEHADTYFRLGEVYQKQKKYDEAIEFYNEALKYKSDEPSYLESLGFALYNANKFEEAITILKRSLKLDSLNPYTHFTLGNIYGIKLKEPEKALSYYNEAIMLEPDIPNGYLNLGNAYTFIERYDEALVAYNKELSIRPKSTATYFNIGRIYKLQGKDDEATTAFEAALALDPNFFPAKQMLYK